jgi:small subunit ribosomal protein S9
MDKQSYFHGTGRRKTATAQVKLMAGNGTIIIDGKPLEQRFPSLEHQRVIIQPFMATESNGKYNAVVKAPP